MDRKEIRVSLCLFLLLVTLSAFGQQVATNNATVVPPLVNFSGTLRDINGKPLTSIVGVTFFLYNDQQALSPLWMETQNVTPDRNGRYSVQLGSTSSTGLPADIFVAGEARWLGVQPEGQAEYPRVMLLSVPYALKAGDAQTIGGLPPSAFVLAPSATGAAPSTRTPRGAPPPSGPVTGSGTVNFLPLWDGTSDIISSSLFQSGSSPTAMIGINTSTPSATLDVATGDVLLEAGNLDLPQTATGTLGVINMAKVPFLHACCAATDHNTYVGANAGSFNNGNGGDNAALGYGALQNLAATGGGNTALGSLAMTLNTLGSDNVAVGTGALQNNTTGTYNTGVGQGALNQTTTGRLNTSLGEGSGTLNSDGLNNTFIGANAGPTNPHLSFATAIGANSTVGESNALVLGGTGGNAVNVGIGTSTPAYTLDVQGTGNFTGMVKFAPGQTFPGTSTITSVTSGTGLTGGGSTGNVTLNVDPTAVPFLNMANVFTGSQTVNGNLSATGVVTGSSFQIGSNLFAFGNFGNHAAFLGFAGNTANTGSDNTASGYLALASNTAGSSNTAVGSSALSANTGGSDNIAIGTGALQVNTFGTSNTAVGAGALESTGGGPSGNGGLWNTAVGSGAGVSNTSGNNNTFIGQGADAATQTLKYATAIGSGAVVGESNAMVLGGTIANGNAVKVGIGTPTPAYTLDVQGNANFTGPITFAPGQTFPGTGTGTITGVTPGTGLTGGGSTGNVTLNVDPTQVSFLNTANVFTGNQTVNGNLSATGTVIGNSFQIGSNLFAYGTYLSGNAFTGFAGSTGTTGVSNTATGVAALSSDTTGRFNTAVGQSALSHNIAGSSNTAVGTLAMYLNTGDATGNGSDNTAVGDEALFANSTGSGNTAVGDVALESNTTGQANTATGEGALFSNTTGFSNTATGNGALYDNTGNDNSANGIGALQTNTAGTYNTAMGGFAGAAVDGSKITASSNTFLGALSAMSTGSLTNATALGANSEVAASNAMVLGSINGVNGATANTNVGIGTTTPAYTLDVHGTANFTGLVNFSPNQTFPGNGTVSSVGSGAGLIGGPITSTGTLSIAPAGVTNAMLANPSVTVSPGTGLTGGGAVSLGGTTTLSLDTTQVPVLNTANVFTGNQTVNGNLSATGTVTGNSFQIGSNLFAFGSYANQNGFQGFAGNANVTGKFNTATGFGALGADTTGSGNTATGNLSLEYNTTGANNTAVGNGALSNNTSGGLNIAIGAAVLTNNSSGSRNVAVGANALGEATTGGYNTAVGNSAGSTSDFSFITNVGLTFLGASSAISTGSLTNATAVGYAAEVDSSNSLVLGSINGINNATASTNVGIGTTTPAYTLDVHGTANFTGLVNFSPNQTFPGNGTVSSVGSGAGLTGGPITSTGTLSIAPAGVTNAMLANPSVTVSPGTGLTGGGAVSLGGTTTLSLDTTQAPLLNNANTFTGNQTVNGNLSATGAVTGSAFNIGSNVFSFGSYASQNAFLGFAGNTTQTGTSNTASGVSALVFNTTGYSNTAIGSQALAANTTGADNAALGDSALESNTTGYTNTAVGLQTMDFNTTGGDNTAVGSQALLLNTTGNLNTGSGFGAGYVADTSNMTGSSNTFLGSLTQMGTGSLTNATAIGTSAEVDSSNSLVLGGISGVGYCNAVFNCATVNVGIGTTKPAYTLDVEAPSGSAPTVNFGSASNPAAFTVHGTGNFTGLVTFAPNQTFPGTGTGTITGVTPTAGGGLMGGGTSGSVALGLTNSCASGQVLQWSGAAWTCSTISGSGTITGVTPGTDLVGGGSSGVVSLSLDTTKVPQLATPNSFASTQTIAGNLALTGSGNGVQFPDGTLQTTAATSVGGSIPSGYMILGSTSTAPPGYTLSGITTSGNVAVSLAPMITARYGMAVMTSGTVIYTFGGVEPGVRAASQNEVYDASSNTWTSLAPLVSPVAYAGAALGFRQAVGYVPAVFGGASSNGAAVATTQFYDPSTNSWSTGMNLPTPAEYLAAAWDPYAGVTLCIGGFSSANAGTALQTVQALTTSGWESYPPMPTARGGLAAVVDTTANKLYAIGGQNGTSAALSTVEVFDLKAQTWGPAASLPTPLSRPSAVFANGQIYVFGTNVATSAFVEIYSPATNTWTSVATPLPKTVTNFGSAAVNNLPYIIGGRGTLGAIGTTELYSPPATLYTFTKN